MQSAKNEQSLRQIMEHLRRGGSYAQFITGDGIRYPYWHKVLYRTANGFIGWSRFGSSACRMNLRDLNWTIRTIFEMSPSAFLMVYREVPADR